MTRDSTPVRILQITDTHLFAERRGLLHGINTRASLKNVLQLAAQQPTPDLLLVTGDLVHDESAKGYRTLFKMLRPFKVPTGVIAGNHDNLEALRAEMPKGFRLGGVYLHGNWRIVLLNSRIPGQPGGHLDNAELYFLEAALTVADQQHVLVVLHHNPFPVGSVWLDRIALNNPQALFALLARFPNVRGVLCGHVHQEFDVQKGRLRLLATPSTCVQFRPGSTDFAVDDQPPGLRWLNLQPDGSIATGVVRLPQVMSGSRACPAR